MKKVWTGLILLTVPILLFASPPRVLNFHSKLTDSAGVGINDTLDITFRLYNVPTGGTPLWSETHSSVPVVKGLFDVTLGAVTPFPDSVDFSEQYYLEIQVGSETMVPRLPLKSAPYAIRAIFADSVATSGVNWDTLGAYVDTSSVPKVLNDLDDVNVPSPSDGQALVYDAGTGQWVPGTVSAGAIDWDTLGAYWDTTNHFATLDTLGAYSDTTHNHNLSDLADVDTSGIADGYVLTWNSTTGHWEAGTVSTADNYADGVSFDDGTNTLTITRTGGLSSLTTTINNEADDLSDNNLNDLGDVNAASPSDGQALVYDSVSGNWVPGTVSSGSIDWDTLGAYWDTTNHFATLDTLQAYRDTTDHDFIQIKASGATSAITDSAVIAGGTGINVSQSNDTIYIEATGGTTGEQKTVLYPEYPNVAIAKFTGTYDNDSVWVTVERSESGYESFYELTAILSAGGIQQYDIAAYWTPPAGFTTVDSVRITYQTNTASTSDNAVTYTILSSGGTTLASSSALAATPAATVTLTPAALPAGEQMIIVANLQSTAGNWARTGKIEIFWQ